MRRFCRVRESKPDGIFGKHNVPRRCVFIGTTNESGFLKDSTGARRFWPLDVEAPIDVSRITADRDQLWAEAAVLEARGVSEVLPRELWTVAAERAADQTSVDPWADALLGYLGGGIDKNGKPEPPHNRAHTSELFRALGIATADQTKDKSQRLRVVMEALLGWHHQGRLRIKDRVGAGYTREPLTDKTRKM
jgi:predicted P-loop ATPase